MVKDNSDSESGNLLPPHGLIFPIKIKGSFICTILQDSRYHGLCYTSCGALAGTKTELRLLYILKNLNLPSPQAAAEAILAIFPRISSLAVGHFSQARACSWPLE